MMDNRSRFRGCLLGLAVGDAVGTTVEFKPPGTFAPLTDMVGGGPFHLPAGAWTDDTSMALCLATSLVTCSGFNANDQMERYWRWYQEGYLSSTGRCFDIGTTTSAGLHRWRHTGDSFGGSTETNTAGNGSIMRLAPVPMFYFRKTEEALRYAVDSARVTHAAPQALQCTQLFAAILLKALAGQSKEEILFGPHFPSGMAPMYRPEIQAIADGAYRQKQPPEITGRGYVVDTLEAALWAFWTTDDYRAAILKVANLGWDADTTAAVCGQVAGAYYGVEGIPSAWLGKLVMREEITQLADAIYRQAASD